MNKDLFEKLPVALFRPLGAQRNRLYWQVLTRLYHKLFDEDIEVGEFGHAKATVVDVIENVLDQHPSLWGQDDEGEDSAGDTRTRANLTYYLLRKAGWLEESRYGYHDYVTMLPRVAQVLSALIEIAEGRPLVMSGKLKALRSGVREVLENPGDEADTLIEIAKDAGRFSRHLGSIRSSIKELYDCIQQDMSVREVVNSFFDDFLREIFIRDYATIKTTENPLTIRDELIEIVTQLRYKHDIKDALLTGYKAIYGEDEQQTARSHLERDLSRLEHVFLNIERQFDAIDQMKMRYEQRVDTVIDYATRSPRTIGRDIKRIIEKLVEHADSIGNDITLRLPLTIEEGVSEARLSQVKRPRKPPMPRKVKRQKVSEEILKKSREERAAKEAIQVDEAALQDFLLLQMGTSQMLESQQLVVNNVRDYFCVLNLQRAARLPAMAEHEFPDLLKDYDIMATDEWAENDYFKMRKTIITKRIS